MRNNTTVPVLIALLILHACAGCTGSVDVSSDGKKLHVDFKPAAKIADNGGDGKTQSLR